MAKAGLGVAYDLDIWSSPICSSMQFCSLQEAKSVWCARTCVCKHICCVCMCVCLSVMTLEKSLKTTFPVLPSVWKGDTRIREKRVAAELRGVRDSWGTLRDRSPLSLGGRTRGGGSSDCQTSGDGRGQCDPSVHTQFF